jgi:hypothetical protein
MTGASGGQFDEIVENAEQTDLWRTTAETSPTYSGLRLRVRMNHRDWPMMVGQFAKLVITHIFSLCAGGAAEISRW